MPNTETELLLYNMVQESKRLLHQWTRTSYMNMERKRELRRRTKLFLRTSSTFTLMNGRLLLTRPVANKPKELFDLLNSIDPANFASYDEFKEKFCQVKR